MSDTYAPGWHAYGDGRPLPIRLAYVAFSPCPCPKKFGMSCSATNPPATASGLFLSLLALGALAAARRRAGEPERDAMHTRFSPWQQRLGTAALFLAVVLMAGALVSPG